MRSGINFASGGSGLQNQTGKILCGPVHTMRDQLDKFTSAVRMMGNCSYELVSRSLVFISVGSNDLFEYAGSNATSSPGRNNAQFLRNLVDYYRGYLQELHAAGARKFSIVSPSLVGCCPSQRFAGWLRDDLDGYGCFGTANDLSRKLYPMVLSMLQDLSVHLSGMNYSIGDSAAMAEPVFNRTGSANTMKVLDTGCCGGSRLLKAVKCSPRASLCPNRGNYLFWDGYHPTETASAGVALALFGDPGRYVHPVNITRLLL